MSTWIALLLLIVAGIVLVFSHGDRLILGLDPGAFAAIATGIALLLFIGLPRLGEAGGRLGDNVRDLAVWALIALGLVAGYGFRDELKVVAERVQLELSPPGTDVGAVAEVPGESAVRVRRRGDGHFIVRARINDEPSELVVDTGASTVVLRPADAERAGIDLSRLSFSVPVQTANGQAFAARARIARITVGGITVRNVEALIAKPGSLTENLLGMSFLSRLKSYEFSGDYMTLRG